MQVLPQCGHAVHEDAPDKVSPTVGLKLLKPWSEMQKGSCSFPWSRDHTSGAFFGTKLAFTSSLDFLAVWKVLTKTLCATRLGYGFNSGARGDVSNSTHVECGFLLPSFPHAVPYYPLH